MDKKILFEQILGKEIEISVEKFNKIFSPSLIEFIKLIRSYGFEVRVIGGAIRDLLEDRIPHDVDLVTDAKFEEILYILEKNKIEHSDKGIQHGTLTVKLNYDTKYEEEYEISSLNFWISLTEESIAGKHDAWFLDATRRDFTCNAIAVDTDGKIWDYFNGIEDLRNSILRIPGIPEEGFTRNPIMMLRWFRFLGYFKKPKFDKNVPDIIAKIIRENPTYFDDLYGKKIWAELSKILMGYNPIVTLKLMDKIGLKEGLKFDWTDPEILRTSKKHCDDPWALVSLIMPNNDIERLSESWEWLPLQAQMVIWLQENMKIDPTFEQGQNWIIEGVQPDWVIKFFLLKGKPAIANEIKQWRLPLFPLQPSKKDSIKSELFESKQEIERVLKEYFHIPGTPTINPDGTVDIDGYCELKTDKKVNQLPVKFGKVSGDFYCNGNRLTSLVGAPHSVGGYFWCDNNQLTSLIGAPQSVGGAFYCNNNQLTSLEGAPQSVGGYFSCTTNQLTSLVGAPQSIGGHFGCSNNQLTSLVGAPQSVGGDFSCSDNQLTSLEGAPQSVGGTFYCDWFPTLPLLRTVMAKKVDIWKDNNSFKEVNHILNSSIKNNPGSYRKAAIDARRKLIDAGYEGNAKW
jgi:hypothetical protein